MTGSGQALLWYILGVKSFGKSVWLRLVFSGDGWKNCYNYENNSIKPNPTLQWAASQLSTYVAQWVSKSTQKVQSLPVQNATVDTAFIDREKHMSVWSRTP